MTNTILGFLTPQIYFAPEGAAAPAAPEPAQQTPPVSEDDFSEEEVVIPEEEGAEPAAETEQPAAQKPRRGPKRYATLTRERDEARSYAEQIAAENARLKKERDDANTRAAASDETAMTTYEAKAKTDLEVAERNHEEALTSNDPAKITAATKALSKATTAMDDVESFKRNKPAAPEPKPAEQPQQRQEQIQDLPQNIKNWAMDNRWWDVVARDDSGNIVLDRTTGQAQRNPDFDAEMHTEATLFSTKLERQIARGTVSYKTGSPEYLKTVTDHMRAEFPEYFSDDEGQEQPPARQTQRGSPVASPGNRNLPGATPKNGAQSYKLSGDEVRFITKSHQNGGGPKYPKGHKLEFKPMSLEDAKVSYARRKMAQAKETPNA